MPYPILLKLIGKKCVVVGGGSVAERRVVRLLSESAAVLIVSPEISPALRASVDAGEVAWLEAEYRSGAFDGAFLVVAATSDSGVNSKVVKDALAANLLVCSAERPQDGNYITPATVERGDLMLTVSTEGASPTLSSVVRRRLEREFGPEWSVWTQLFRVLRTTIQQAGDESQRVEIVERVLADRQTAAAVRGTDLAVAEKAARICISLQLD